MSEHSSEQRRPLLDTVRSTCVVGNSATTALLLPAVTHLCLSALKAVQSFEEEEEGNIRGAVVARHTGP